MDKLKPHAENCDGEVTLDSQRNPTGMEGINLEIIPLKKSEVDLEALNIELEARVKQRTEELTSLYLRLQNELEERQQIELEKQNSEEFYSEYLERELMERRRIEQALIESEIRYRRIVETASEGIWQLDQANKTVFVNPRMAEMLGYSLEEMMGKSILDFLLETDKKSVEFLFEQRQDSSLPSYDIQFSRQDGSILWGMVSTRPILDDSGQYLGCLKMITDISDRKENEAIVKEFNRRWRSVLDSIQMIIVELDKNGKVEHINPFFEKITQFSPEEVLGKHWVSNFIPTDITTPVETVFQGILKENKPEYFVNPILTKSGEHRLIAWRNSVLKNNTQESIGLIGIGEDITEKFRLERMKSEFISIVSHELKTPLTAMQVSLSLLDGKFIDPASEEGEESIKIATEGVDRLVRLVDDILDLERLRTGKLTIVKTNCHTQNIIKGAIAQTKELVKQTEIKIAVPKKSFACFVDGDRLIQVLTNLITNAIKFSPYQSTIELSISEEIDDQPYLLFSIRDRGRGIPSNNLESIFERFQQVDASDSREKGGTGLGLAISRDIVEQHGGKIWAESVLEEGSTFFFTIPIESTEVTSGDN